MRGFGSAPLPVNRARAKLLLTNLPHDLQNEHLLSLFGKFGRVKEDSSWVHYDQDRHGQSVVTAEVHFERWRDACNAMEVYKGLIFSGKHMRNCAL